MRDLGKCIAELVSTGVAKRDELEGCTESDLVELEQRLQVRLPATYRAYLARIGRSAGALFAHDRYDATYAAALSWTEHLRAAGWVVLPEGAVVIGVRLSEQFEFITCQDEDDPPVWYVAKWEPGEVMRSHPSVSEWLNAWLREAVVARGG